MPISIGIITARQSLDNIRQAEQSMKQHCKISYFPYDTLDELRHQYTKAAAKSDGLLFSGPFPHDYICENIGRITLPSRCIDLMDRDYYLVIARLLVRNPKLDFTRVYFDAVVEPSIIGNVFPPGLTPYFMPRTTPEYRMILRSSAYQRFLNQYRSMWAERKYDLFLTRFTNLALFLEKEQIPHILLKPSPETILDHFHALLCQIRESLLQNSQTACCIIELPRPFQNQKNMEILEKILADLKIIFNQNILIRRHHFHLEITASIMVVRELTSGYTSCLLSEELEKRLPFPFFAGWGISFDVVDAYKNAATALSACKKDQNHYTFLVTESQEMVGPLNSNRSISYSLKPHAQTSSLAKSLGISPINLEKIISLQKERSMYEFTSSDLVYFLEITPRSASRILSKLSSADLAHPVRTINLNGTGRPLTVYEIDFSNIKEFWGSH